MQRERGRPARRYRLALGFTLAVVMTPVVVGAADPDGPEAGVLTINRAIAGQADPRQDMAGPLPLPPRRPVTAAATAAAWAETLKRRRAEAERRNGGPHGGSSTAGDGGANAAPTAKIPASVAAAAHVRQARQYEQIGLLDRAIEEYTRAVVADPGHVDAYLGRGWAYVARGLYQPAIDSFNQAIDLRADFAAAYFGRGWAYERMGHLENAIMEYSEATRLEPDFLDAYFSRGMAYFYDGRDSEAVADFDLVQGRASDRLRDYALLWSYVTRLRSAAASGEDPAAIRAAYRRRPIRTAWPGVIISLFKGDVTAADVEDAIGKAPPSRRRQWRCVGSFFLGQFYLIHGDRRTAGDYFQKTLKTGVTGYRQYWAAKAELERLAKKAD